VQVCTNSRRHEKKSGAPEEVQEIKNKNNLKAFIQKTTTIWLLQEGECVSTDRLFQVRSKQPYSSDITTEISTATTKTNLISFPQYEGETQSHKSTNATKFPGEDKNGMADDFVEKSRADTAVNRIHKES